MHPASAIVLLFSGTDVFEIYSLTTSDKTPRVFGRAKQYQGETVTVTINAVEYVGTVDSNGDWYIQVTDELDFGFYEISATILTETVTAGLKVIAIRSLSLNTLTIDKLVTLTIDQLAGLLIGVPSQSPPTPSSPLLDLDLSAPGVHHFTSYIVNFSSPVAVTDNVQITDADSTEFAQLNIRIRTEDGFGDPQAVDNSEMLSFGGVGDIDFPLGTDDNQDKVAGGTTFEIDYTAPVGGTDWGTFEITKSGGGNMTSASDIAELLNELVYSHSGLSLSGATRYIELWIEDDTANLSAVATTEIAMGSVAPPVTAFTRIVSLTNDLDPVGPLAESGAIVERDLWTVAGVYSEWGAN